MAGEIQWTTTGTARLFGDDLPHDNGMMPWKHIIGRQTDPAVLLPDLFAGIDPDFAARVRPGDFIVAGQRFGTGKAHTTAYVALSALGVRVLCESSFEKVVRGAANLGVPILAQCDGISRVVRDGDVLTVDMLAGEVRRAADGACWRYPPLRTILRKTIEDGGRIGLLTKWLSAHPELREPLVDA
jgi:3-isopropylmalate dehydratase small subunit